MAHGVGRADQADQADPGCAALADLVLMPRGGWPWMLSAGAAAATTPVRAPRLPPRGDAADVGDDVGAAATVIGGEAWRAAGLLGATLAQHGEPTTPQDCARAETSGEPGGDAAAACCC